MSAVNFERRLEGGRGVEIWVSVLIFRRTLLGYYAEGMHANFFIKFDLNTANDGASAKASPFHALIVLGKNDCLYSASCMIQIQI